MSVRPSVRECCAFQKITVVVVVARTAMKIFMFTPRQCFRPATAARWVIHGVFGRGGVTTTGKASDLTTAVPRGRSGGRSAAVACRVFCALITYLPLL